MKAVIGIGGLALVGFVAWTMWPKEPDVATACAPVTEAIGAEIPTELAAMLDRTCAAAFVAVNGPSRAFDLGYPSLAFDHADENEVLAVIDATAGEGDRGFFASDPAILDRLPDGLTADFVRASRDAQAALSQANDVGAVLRAIPIWGNDANMEVIVDGCGDFDCATDASDCAGYVGLADKLRVAQGTATLAEVQTACPVSPGWVLGLRRAGLVDTACTSTLAVNRAMADPATLGTACYPSGLDASALPAIGSADYPRLVRANGIDGVSAGTLRVMQSAYPEAAAYLTTAGGS